MRQFAISICLIPGLLLWLVSIASCDGTSSGRNKTVMKQILAPVPRRLPILIPKRTRKIPNRNRARPIAEVGMTFMHLNIPTAITQPAC